MSTLTYGGMPWPDGFKAFGRPTPANYASILLDGKPLHAYVPLVRDELALYLKPVAGDFVGINIIDEPTISYPANASQACFEFVFKCLKHSDHFFVCYSFFDHPERNVKEILQARLTWCNFAPYDGHTCHNVYSAVDSS